MSNAPSVNQLRHLDRELETVLASFDTNYVWNYGSVKEGLHDLYEKAKRDQWNGTTQLAWDTQVDPESDIIPPAINPFADYAPFKKLNDKERARLRHAQISLQLSQFLHGEQGALIVASQLVGGVPWMDAKYYAGTQTMDEARHVEVFSRYLHDKLEWEWPINANLKELLDATIKDSRWDFKYLGMQIIIEGLAMAAFGNLYQLAQEPLLKELLKYVMKDESRHVAFGVLSLRDYYQDLSPAEISRPRGLHHLCLRADAEPADRRRHRERDGMECDGGPRGGPGVAGGAALPQDALHAHRAEPEEARPADAARARSVRSPRHPPVRGLRLG